MLERPPTAAATSPLHSPGHCCSWPPPRQPPSKFPRRRSLQPCAGPAANAMSRRSPLNSMPSCAALTCAKTRSSSTRWASRHCAFSPHSAPNARASNSCHKPPKRRSSNTPTTRSSPVSPASPTKPARGSWLRSATTAPASPAPDSLKAFAGSAPVTRASGRSRVVSCRRIKNDRLAAVGFTWGLSALNLSPGARAHYDRRRAACDGHAAAFRNLFNRFLGCLHRCLHKRLHYNETIAFPPTAPAAA